MAKKLTKTQVKRILTNISKNYSRLFKDKFEQINSHVPIGAQRLANMLMASKTEINRVK